MEFADQNSLEPNSLGEILISADISIDVRIIFELFNIDCEKRILIGARSRQDLCAKLFADSGRPEVSRQ